MSIATALKNFRRQFGYSASQVAERLGIVRQAYNPYEREESPVIPRANVIIQLAKEFNVSTDYLLGLTDDPRPNWKNDNEAGLSIKNAKSASEQKTTDSEPTTEQVRRLEKVNDALQALQLQIKGLQKEIDDQSAKIEKLEKSLADIKGKSLY